MDFFFRLIDFPSAETYASDVKYHPAVSNFNSNQTVTLLLSYGDSSEVQTVWWSLKNRLWQVELDWIWEASAWEPAFLTSTQINHLKVNPKRIYTANTLGMIVVVVKNCPSCEREDPVIQNHGQQGSFFDHQTTALDSLSVRLLRCHSLNYQHA